MISSKLPHQFFGGDYCPEQWPKNIREEDIRLMKKAGVNLVNLAIFSWVRLQSDENTFTFDWLDEVMDLLAKNNIFVDLATPTASPPEWMFKKYPDMLPVDEKGIRYGSGSRNNFCPNNKNYRRFSKKIAAKLAQHYEGHPALAMWHVNNEYSHCLRVCYCEVCAQAFIRWLKKKYSSLEVLNQTWGADFWGHRYLKWSEITPPRFSAQAVNTGLLLDYRRFMNDSYLDCYLNEVDVLKKYTPDIPVTNNFLKDFKTLDYFSWAPHLDFISVASFADPDPKNYPGIDALSCDIMRGLKKGTPFIFMEQAPSQVSWSPANLNKRPGVMRLVSYQGMAHGSDGFLFFQWRQSIKGIEKFHSAMVPHIGENSRIYREMVQLGNELKKLDEIIDSTVPAEVALVLDYNNWWTLETPPRPTDYLKYLDQIRNFYNPLYDSNIPADIIEQTDNLNKYKVVIAPALYMLKPGFKENIESFVARGGVFITNFSSGLVDHTDTVFSGGYPGPLSNVLGLKIEEFDPLKPHMSNTVLFKETVGQLKGEYKCNLWCDVIKPSTARTLGVYKEDYYANCPCITENKFKKGKAYYIGTNPEKLFFGKFLKCVCEQQKVKPVLETPEGVEAYARVKDKKKFFFVLNHNNSKVEIKLPQGVYYDMLTQKNFTKKIELEAKDLAILKIQHNY